MNTDVGQLESLWAVLMGGSGLVAAIVAWVGAVRAVLKLTSKQLQEGMTTLVSRAAGSKTKQDDELVERILSSLWYRFIAFLVDWLGSIKLPTLETWEQLKGGE